MTRYELTTIVADESATNPAVQVVEQHGGIVIREEAAGKRRFTYPINKLTNGVYHRITFDADRSAIAAIDAALRQDATLIRYLIVEQHAEPPKPVVKVEDADIEAIGDVQEMNKAEEAAKAAKKSTAEVREEAAVEETPTETIEAEVSEQPADDSTAAANAAVKDESVVDEATRQAALDEKLKNILGK